MLRSSLAVCICIATLQACLAKQNCGPGQYVYNSYSSGGSHTSCRSCNNGKYSDTVGATTCKSCPAGTSNRHAGSSSVTACTACDPGKYSSYHGAYTCTYCPGGTTTSISGASSSSMCNQTLPQCQVGQYRDRGEDAQCKPCMAGKYNPFAGATSSSQCVSCPNGRYSTTPGASSPVVCSSCPLGSYSSRSGASECKACSTGKNTVTAGAGSAAACVATTISYPHGQNCENTQVFDAACPAPPYGKYFPTECPSECSAAFLPWYNACRNFLNKLSSNNKIVAREVSAFTRKCQYQAESTGAMIDAWNQTSSVQCADSLLTATVYTTEGSAQTACHGNRGCSGVMDQKCDGTGSFQLCRAGRNYATSYTGSCIYTKPAPVHH